MKMQLPIFDQFKLEQYLGPDVACMRRDIYNEYLIQLDELSWNKLNSYFLEQNRVEIAVMAHKLKSSSQLVGAELIAAAFAILCDDSQNDLTELQAAFSKAQKLLEPTKMAVTNEIIKLSAKQEQG